MNPASRQDDNNFSVRADHNFNPSHQIFGRYNRNRVSAVNPNGWVNCCDDINAYRNHQSTLSYTATLSPTAINELKAVYNRWRQINSDSSFGTDFATLLGVRNTLQTGDAYQFPSLSITGYAAPAGTRLYDARLNQYILSDHFTLIRGAHALKAGFEYGKFQYNDAYSVAMPFAATFSGIFSGNGLADMLLGKASSLSVNYRNPVFEPRITHWEAYVQDDWKASSRLTVNLGVRFSVQNPFTERQNEMSNFNLRTGALIIPQSVNIGNFQGLVERIPGNSFVQRDVKAAPRISFAYQLGGNDKAVVRGGYGIFTALEQGNVHRQVSTNPPFRLIWNGTDNTNGFGWNTGRPTFDEVLAGYARGFSTQFIESAWQNGYVQNWNLTVERELLSATSLSVGYVGSKGTGLSRLFPLNTPLPGPGAIQPRRPYPDYAGITYIQNASNSTYHSMQARLERRFSKGFMLLSSYTWAKALGDASTFNGNFIQDINCNRCEKGRQLFDARQRAVVSYSYELPFGPGRSWLTSGPAAHLLGGWTLAGITQFQTGLALTVASGRDNANTGVGNRPDRVLGVDINPPKRDINAWIPVTGFVQNQAFAYGNAGKGIVDSPGISLFDVSAIRQFRFGESVRLDFRAEFLNLFNRANFGNPVTTLTAGNFGAITSAGEPRDIQLALKVVF